MIDGIAAACQPQQRQRSLKRLGPLKEPHPPSSGEIETNPNLIKSNRTIENATHGSDWAKKDAASAAAAGPTNFPSVDSKSGPENVLNERKERESGSPIEPSLLLPCEDGSSRSSCPPEQIPLSAHSKAAGCAPMRSADLLTSEMASQVGSKSSVGAPEMHLDVVQRSQKQPDPSFSSKSSPSSNGIYNTMGKINSDHDDDDGNKDCCLQEEKTVSSVCDSNPVIGAPVAPPRVRKLHRNRQTGKSGQENGLVQLDPRSLLANDQDTVEVAIDVLTSIEDEHKQQLQQQLATINRDSSGSKQALAPEIRVTRDDLEKPIIAVSSKQQQTSFGPSQTDNGPIAASSSAALITGLFTKLKGKFVEFLLSSLSLA